MFDTPTVMKIAHASAAHAAQRQTVIAANVANADTPGYRARDVENFASFLERSRETGRNRPSLPALQAGQQARLMDLAQPAAPNGNTVALESEMVRAVETRKQHEMALTIYRSAGSILRAALGR